MTARNKVNINRHDNCPSCGENWRYEPGGGHVGTHLVAIIEGDRVAWWECPGCGQRWKRGEAVARNQPSVKCATCKANGWMQPAPNVKGLEPCPTCNPNARSSVKPSVKPEG